MLENWRGLALPTPLVATSLYIQCNIPLYYYRNPVISIQVPRHSRAGPAERQGVLSTGLRGGEAAAPHPRRERPFIKDVRTKGGGGVGSKADIVRVVA